MHGENHFIVRGPLPDREIALALVRFWSLIRIGAKMPSSLEKWSIVSKEFRENLEWAVVTPGDGEITSAVTALLEEMAARYHGSRFPARTLDLSESRANIVACMP